ncbi:hypothetical protein Q3A66_01280 [Hymenobacter sp. BT770]|uniref:hypothetical protein n=1 Tax=Hymenobacter sp. BT770 TaxID=2886942 RepID=UPI0026739AB3|nr:hypothetical protein [Hymenobacter sp. BT770]MDO3413683.1 hypothetical protein [Hymenobacter sp. BT770]
MKNLLTAFLPALALLALGGCASTAGLASSEDDGVYYSSKDHTTAVVSTAPTPASTNEAANPDYNGNSNQPSARQNSGSDQYYDNTYTYMRGVPGYGPGVTYYTPYSPYTSLSYPGGYGYGWGAGACGFSPYAFCDPFYSPIYSPFGYGYGSSLSISLGFGRPYGYGSVYYGYARPYGYGYGGGFYDPFYYSSPFYGGYYGRGAYYGSSYYGGNNYSYGNRYSGGDNARPRTSGHRTDRSSDDRYSSGGSVSNPGGAGTTGTGNGRVRNDDRVAMPNPTTQPYTSAPNEGRVRTQGTAAPQPTESTPGRNAYNEPRRPERTEQPVYRDMSQPTEGGQVTRDNSRGRWRNDEAAPQSNDRAQPQEGQRRRGGFFQNILTEPSNSGGQATEQPSRQRSYEQPQQPQRSYEQPQQQQRAYEQPQPQRQQSYEQPQRSSQPSYSAPSNNSGGGGHSRSRPD